MDREATVKHCDELWRMVGEIPGAYEADISRARQIFAELGTTKGAPYFLDKLGDARIWLGYWHSPQRWRKWGNTPDHLRGIVQGAIYKLRLAIPQGSEHIPSSSH